VRQKTFRLRRLAVAALGAATAVSGIAVLAATPAGAVSPAPNTTPFVLSGTGTPVASIVNLGQKAQPATSLTTTIGDGYATADAYVINLPQCITAANSIAFAAVPTVTVTAANGTATAPTFTASLAQQPGEGAACAGIKDQLNLAVGNTDASALTSNVWNVTISGIAYDVGASVAIGSVALTANYVQGATGGSTTPVTVASNAIVSAVAVTTNSPLVLGAPAVGTAISPIVLTEGGAGSVGTGYVCIQLLTPLATFSTAGTVSTTAASAVVGASVRLNGNSALSFPVTTASTVAGTYTVSGVIAVDPNAGPVIAKVFNSATACGASTADYSNSSVLFTVFSVSRIYGQVQDGTAVANLASQFPPATNQCPGTAASLLSGTPNYRPVVLATDQNYPDALTAAYLASGLKTGVLLTPSGSLSADAMLGLRTEGISNVFIVGGPIAVNDAVVTQLKATPSYLCGGNALLGQNLTVTQIFGQTQYDTAQAVANYFGVTGLGTASFNGAYPTGTTGTSTYNTTTGSSGTVAPSTAIRTRVAIVTTGENFPDATSASRLSYVQQWPILLTQQASLAPQAQSAIINLGIQQVVVMGGPIAVSDAVVTQLEGLGVSVLRIGGSNQTDTSSLLAQFELNGTFNGGFLSDGLGWVASGSASTYRVTVARGDDFADALSGSVVGGPARVNPIVLTSDPATLGTGIPALFSAEANLAPGLLTPYHVSSITILGGPLAVNPAVEAAILAAAAAAQ
jgi:putative cell wall-binding protein